MRIIFYKQIGYFNVLYRGLILKFYKNILRKKKFKFNTTLNTNYNIFSWDPCGSEVFATNSFPDWGNEYFFLQTLKNRPRNIFLDIGCHTGSYACLFKNIFNRIIGFEPSKDCQEVLELTKSENNNFNYYKCFLGNDNKEIILKQSYEDSLKGSIHIYNEEIKHSKTNKTTEEKISIYKLDDFLKHKKINDEISGIKIDVDGVDLDIVRGAMETIKKFRPSISIENYSQDLISIMNKIDYQIFSFTYMKDRPYNMVFEKLEAYNSKKSISMSVCIPSEYVPKLTYPQEIRGNVLFGINMKLILNNFL